MAPSIKIRILNAFHSALQLGVVDFYIPAYVEQSFIEDQLKSLCDLIGEMTFSLMLTHTFHTSDGPFNTYNLVISDDLPF